MPQKIIAATTIIVAVATLITLKTWKMKCEANKDARIFDYAKQEAIKAAKEQYKEDSDLYLLLLKRRTFRLEELDRKIAGREETLKTLRDLTGRRCLDKYSMSPI